MSTGPSTLPHFDGRPLRALVFDLDGTLVDSARDLRAALDHALAARGRPTLDTRDVRAMTGDGIAKLVERGFAATGGVPDAPALRAAVDDVLAAYEARPVAETVPYPGVIEALTDFRAAGLRMAICTNKVTGLSRLILAALGLDVFFDIGIGGDSLPQRKPEPEPVRACLATAATIYSRRAPRACRWPSFPPATVKPKRAIRRRTSRSRTWPH